MAMEEQTGIIPATLPSKYMISKVLGRGVTGDMRLGFRIPNLHRVGIKIISARKQTALFPRRKPLRL
jgi:hypothetical protein